MTKQYCEYLARKATWSKSLADAAMSLLEAGGSIRLTTYCGSRTYTSQSVRRVGDAIQVYDGRSRGRDSWVPMDSNQLARQVGMVSFVDMESAR